MPEKKFLVKISVEGRGDVEFSSPTRFLADLFLARALDRLGAGSSVQVTGPDEVPESR